MEFSKLKNKKLLITGGNGLLGKTFQSKNIDYKIYAPSSKECNLFIKDDIKNYIRNTNPDFVVHCACKVGGIQANILNQFEFGHSNMLMYLNLLSSLKELNISCKILNIGSSCMYPRNSVQPLKIEYLGIGELEPTNESYGFAKLFGTKLCQHLSDDKSNNLELKTLIAPNLYGPFDKFNEDAHLIPAVIKKIDNKKNEDLALLPAQPTEIRREFMFSEDFADAMWFSINNWEKIPSILNVGIGCDFSIKEYYDIIANVLGVKVEYSDYDHSMPKGMKQKLLDSSDAFKIGIYPKTSLKEGIEKTYKYYLENIK